MEYIEIRENDEEIFHQLLNAYYREGEDEHTPQSEMDSFIRLLFGKVINGEINGLFAKEGTAPIGFALWAIDIEGFAFSEMPGFGTILEIGVIPSCRSAGRGKQFVRWIETCLRSQHIQHCYVSAYGPAQAFWTHCGYAENGQKASNGLAIMTRAIG